MRRSFRPLLRCPAALLSAAAVVSLAWADPTDPAPTPLVQQAPVLSVGWTDDNGAIVTGSRDGTVQVWDAAHLDGAPLVLSDPGATFTWAVAVRPGSRSHALAGGRDGTVRYWRFPDGRPDVTIKGASAARALAASPDGTRFVVGMGTRVLLWGPTGGALSPLPGPAPAANVGALAWGADPSVTGDGPIAAGDADGAITLWARSNDSSPLSVRSPAGRVNGLAFLPDKTLLSADADGKLRRWAFPFTPPAVSNALNPITRFAVSTDGTTLATAGDTSFQVWTVGGAAVATVKLASGESLTRLAVGQDGQSVACAVKSDVIRYYKGPAFTAPPTPIPGTTSDLSALAFRLTADSAGKDVAVAATAATGAKSAVVTTLSATAVPPATIGPLAGAITALAFDPTGAFLYVGTAGTSGELVTGWNPTGPTKVAGMSGHTGDVLCLGVSPDGKTIVSGSADSTARLWKNDGSPLATLPCGGPVISAAFSADGARLATTTAQSVRLWDVTNPSQPIALQDLTVDSTSAVGGAPSPAAKKAVTAAWADGLRTWATAATAVLDPGSNLGPAHAVAVSPSGKKAAAAHENKAVVIYDLTGAVGPKILAGHNGPVRAVVFASESRLLSASLDKTVNDWDLSMSPPPPSTTNLPAPVRALAVDAGGLTLVASLDDGTAHVFDLTTGVRKTMAVSVGANGKPARAVALLAPDSAGAYARAVVGSDDTSTAVTVWPVIPSPPDPSKVQPVRKYVVKAEVFAVAWVPTGAGAPNRFVTGSGDGSLNLWDVGGTGPAVSVKAHPGRVSAVAATTDAAGKTVIASGGDEPTIRFWDGNGTARPTTAPGSLSSARSVRCLAFNTAGTLLASGSDDQTVRACQADGTSSQRVGAHAAAVIAVAFRPKDTALLAAVDSGGTVKFWDVTKLAPAAPDLTLPPGAGTPFGVAWSPDGTTLGVAVAPDRALLFQPKLP